MAELGLGTVQFGLDYGVTNERGRPAADEVTRIVDLALAQGIRTFDTAPAYRSESVLGRALGGRASEARLVTKTAPAPGGTIDTGVVETVVAAFEGSLADLGVPAVAGLLVHHGGELTRPGGRLLADAVRDLRNRGLVERVGFSVYDPEELEAAAAMLEPEIVQLPLNLVDQRFLASGAVEQLAEGGVEVHVRSAFLQGILLERGPDLPGGLAGLAPITEKLERISAEAGVSRLAAPLGFCLTTPGVSTVLVGVNTASELKGVLDAASREVLIDPSEFARDDAALVDPRRWS
jgi:aryl-alcohol dehydrogenase-like predicted oxidoreductase